MTQDKPLCMTTKDVAQELQMNVDVVRKLIRNGVIPHRRIGGAIRILRSELLSFLDAQVELQELRGAETRSAAPQRQPGGELDAEAQCHDGIADRWRLNLIKR